MGQRAHRYSRRLAQETLKLSFACFLRLFNLEFGSRVLLFPISGAVLVDIGMFCQSLKGEHGFSRATER